jgi:hypothetical protein
MAITTSNSTRVNPLPANHRPLRENRDMAAFLEKENENETTAILITYPGTPCFQIVPTAYAFTQARHPHATCHGNQTVQVQARNFTRKARSATAARMDGE